MIKSKSGELIKEQKTKLFDFCIFLTISSARSSFLSLNLFKPLTLKACSPCLLFLVKWRNVNYVVVKCYERSTAQATSQGITLIALIRLFYLADHQNAYTYKYSHQSIVFIYSRFSQCFASNKILLHSSKSAHYYIFDSKRKNDKRILILIILKLHAFRSRFSSLRIRLRTQSAVNDCLRKKKYRNIETE